MPENDLYESHTSITKELWIFIHQLRLIPRFPYIWS